MNSNIEKFYEGVPKIDLTQDDCKDNVIKNVREAAKKCCELKTAFLSFSKGIYNFIDDKAVNDFKLLMSGKLNADTQWGRDGVNYNKAVEFKECDKLIIDGMGSKFIFNGLIAPFSFINCSNVVLRNITIDWQRPPFSIGRVISVENDVITVEIFPEYPVVGGEPVWSFHDYDPQMRHLGKICPFREMSAMKLISPQVVQFTYGGARLVKPDSLLVIRHIGNYRPAIHLLNCKDVYIENVTINAVPGMGVIAHRSENINFKNFEVRPTQNRIMSTTTDATHFISCMGTVQFENCYFEGMGDDAANVHSFYFSVKQVIDKHTVVVTIDAQSGVQDQVFDYPDVGDNVEFIRIDTLHCYASGCIESVDTDLKNWTARIYFKDCLPENFKNSDLIANTSKLARLRFINCTIKDIRARGLLIQTRKAIVRNCLFSNCTGTGIHIDTAVGWRESIGTRDVTIQNNTFMGCGYGPGTYNGTSAIVAMTECEVPYVGVHKNICIKNNNIYGCDNTGIYISCTDSGEIKENHIEKCEKPIDVQHSKNIKIYNNEIIR